MTPPTEDPEPPTRRFLNARTLGTLGFVVVALGAAAYLTALAVTAPGDETVGPHRSIADVTDVETPGPSQSSPPTPGPEQTPSDVPEATDGPAAPSSIPPEDVSAAATKFLESSVAIDPTAADPHPGLGDAASGAILAEVENDAQELEANGWTREGSATIDGLTVVSSDSAADPATVVVQACVDSSKVRTLDHSGEPIGDSGSAVNRALNIYTLQYIDDAWKVVARTFPDDPAC